MWSGLEIVETGAMWSSLGGAKEKLAGSGCFDAEQLFN
jgi:hypothetical protein